MICNALMWSFGPITRIDWLEVVKALASLATVAIAYAALRNWQKQDRAKRETEFLDALIEAAHAFIEKMARPISLIGLARSGMLSQVSSFDDRDEAARVAAGAIPFIQAHGEQYGKRLIEALNEARPSSIKLRSLGTKGQVFGFSGYDKCHHAVTILTWQFDRIEAFTTIVGSPDMNWNNPDINRTLQKVLMVDESGIQKYIGERNITIIAFVSDTYAKAYGSGRNGG